MSMMDGFKEKESGAYQHIVDAGKVESGYGYTGWARVGTVHTSFLHPPDITKGMYLMHKSMSS